MLIDGKGDQFKMSMNKCTILTDYKFEYFNIINNITYNIQLFIINLMNLI